MSLRQTIETLKAGRAPAPIAPAEKVDQRFISLWELLTRMRCADAPVLTWSEAASVVLHLLYDFGDKAPAWQCNSRRINPKTKKPVGVTKATAAHADIAATLLWDTYKGGRLVTDGPTSRHSLDYELFGFDRALLAEHAQRCDVELPDLLSAQPDAAHGRADAPAATEVQTSVPKKRRLDSQSAFAMAAKRHSQPIADDMDAALKLLNGNKGSNVKTKTDAARLLTDNLAYRGDELRLYKHDAAMKLVGRLIASEKWKPAQVGRSKAKG